MSLSHEAVATDSAYRIQEGHSELVLTTAAAADRDRKHQSFWEAVCDLIFKEQMAPDWKGSALRRYSRALHRRGDKDLADFAERLANSYQEVSAAVTHW